MNDLFDELEPSDNSPEDLGWTPRQDRIPEWDPRHEAHPSKRPDNQLESGETAPERWNVATTDLGILHVRKFLTWWQDEIDGTIGEHTVGSLYVALNGYDLDRFRWLMTVLKRSGRKALPSTECMVNAINACDPALLYDKSEGERHGNTEEASRI